MVGRITDGELPNIQAQALLVGHVYNEPRVSSPIHDRFSRLPWQMEVFVEQIGSFQCVADTARPTAAEVARLKTIPEQQVKQAFAEIIGEQNIPKDWGGEHSDLVSAHMTLEGERVVTAFAFKGPSKAKPLTVADLGKNGDQISRLYSEPADLVILQHCHHITPAVRDHMRAFSTRIGRLRPFCLLDAFETARIFKAYGKLGYT